MAEVVEGTEGSDESLLVGGLLELAKPSMLGLRRLRIFGQQNKLRADRSKGRETWA
jgi:hypothetical protein